MTKPSLNRLFRSGLAAAAVLVLSRAPMQAQAGGDQTVTLDLARGRVSGTLRLPSAPARPPVVYVVSPSDATELASALAAEGVASLRVNLGTSPGTGLGTGLGASVGPGAGPNDVDTMAQWISFLRNDDRFPTVTVLGAGVALLPAVVAARAARADGIITRGDASAAAEELSRVVAKVGTAPGASVAADAARIAAFARTVPTLGRRGTLAARPAVARRSPRHTIVASVGAVRVAIEWGQPEKRGREVWGNLVRWDNVWMPGADEATVITTNGRVTIGSLDVPARDHTLYTLPAADRFELLVSRDVGQFHTVYDASLVLGRVPMTLSRVPDSVEGLTFAIEPRGSAAAFKLIWDPREYSASLAAK